MCCVFAALRSFYLLLIESMLDGTVGDALCIIFAMTCMLSLNRSRERGWTCAVKVDESIVPKPCLAMPLCLKCHFLSDLFL